MFLFLLQITQWSSTSQSFSCSLQKLLQLQIVALQLVDNSRGQEGFVLVMSAACQKPHQYLALTNGTCNKEVLELLLKVSSGCSKICGKLDLCRLCCSKNLHKKFFPSHFYSVDFAREVVYHVVIGFQPIRLKERLFIALFWISSHLLFMWHVSQGIAMYPL